MLDYDTKDIIFALATAPAKGAIAVIRVSGEGCLSAFAGHFRSSRRLTSVASGTAVFGTVRDGERILDDSVVTVYRDGHGYTGEEAFEISCHGGLTTVRAILSFLAAIGFRQAGRGEFTLRAFLHGKMDLTRAEAVNELVNSRAQKAMDAAVGRLNGSLFKRINEIKDMLVSAMGVIEVQLDYAEDEIAEDTEFPLESMRSALSLIDVVLSSYSTGRLYSDGLKIVLAGAANAGKSSLFNLFLKEDRAIVSPVAGTTRDYIEAVCTLGGIPVTLYDTAGLRDAGCDIEEEGIRRSRRLMDEADIVVFLVDATSPEMPEAVLSADPRFVGVVNKTDSAQLSIGGYIPLSVKTGEGFGTLCERISSMASERRESCDGVVIESPRQKQCLERARDSISAALMAQEAGLPLDMVSVDVQEAIEALGEITGEVTSDDILDNIFSSFCVGK